MREALSELLCQPRGTHVVDGRKGPWCHEIVVSFGPSAVNDFQCLGHRRNSGREAETDGCEQV